MNDQKKQRLIEQAGGKVIWGATEKEIVLWLTQEHGFDLSESLSAYQSALKRRKRNVREKAIIHLVCSGIGLLAVTGFFLGQILGHFVIIGWGVILVLGLGVVCFISVFKNLFYLLTGND